MGAKILVHGYGDWLQAGRVKKPPGLYLRGNVWWLTFRHNEQKKFVSLQTSNYGEAIDRAIKVRGAPAFERTGKLSDERERFLADKCSSGVYSRHSAEWAETPLKHLETFVGDIAANAVTPAQIKQFAHSLRLKLTQASAASYLRAVSSFFSWLEEGGRVHLNPVTKLPKVKVTQAARVTFCEREQRDRLISAALDDDMRLILLLGFHAGLRKGEIIEARPRWVDFDGGTINVEQTESFRSKDRESRTVPMTKALREFLASRPLPAPFLLKPEVKRGAALYRYDFRLPFALHVRACGLPWVTPHTMRRTFASLLVSAGVSIYKVARWLGDSVAVAEKHYGHLDARDVDIERSHIKPANPPVKRGQSRGLKRARPIA